MRVTQKTSYITYESNLRDIQERKLKNEVRISTGRDIINLADAPDRAADVKKLLAKIDSNNKYIENLDESISEMQSATTKMDTINERLQEIRTLAIDATQVGNSITTATLGETLKGILEDVINIANSDYNGKLLFSGTKTTHDSINPAPPQQNSNPFELIEGAATDDNPSGLSVVFKGNFNERIINKDDNSTEAINVTADKIFGAGGTEVFDSIIELYNQLVYNDDGSRKETYDVLGGDDVEIIDGLQKKIADQALKMNTATAEAGGKINRLTSMRDMLESENLILEDIRSVKGDTNIPKRVIDLKLDESALQYSLQVGSRILQTSLFDFLR